MRIRVIGAGFYGSHLALALLDAGHDVEVHESGPRVFSGASGGIPARLHLGAPHYPRSALTRAACIEHRADFMERYGHLTRAVPINLYAVAAHDSLVDFGTYLTVLREGTEFLTVHDPAEFGLANIEGAVLTGERHVVVRLAREHFEKALAGRVLLGTSAWKIDDPQWDWTIDASFCANDSAGVDRYEPCVTVLLEGPTDKSVTVVDGPFPSLYVWDEDEGLCSLTSARLTPISKAIRSVRDARQCLNAQGKADLDARGEAMLDQMEAFYPQIRSLLRIADYRLSIRAMPRSGSDARLVDVVRVGERALRVRAGKIDAIVHAERLVKQIIGEAE
jgi:hypothetical protein